MCVWWRGARVNLVAKGSNFGLPVRQHPHAAHAAHTHKISHTARAQRVRCVRRARPQEAKKLELQQRLAQLQQQLVDENNAYLAEEARKWDQLRGEVEGNLRESLRVPSVASESDSDSEGGEHSGDARGGRVAPGAHPVPEGVQGRALFWLRTMSSQFTDLTNRYRLTNVRLGASAKDLLVARRQLLEQGKEVAQLRLQLDEQAHAPAPSAAAGAGPGRPCPRCAALQVANRELLAKVSMLENQVAIMSAASVAHSDDVAHQVELDASYL